MALFGSAAASSRASTPALAPGRGGRPISGPLRRRGERRRLAAQARRKRGGDPKRIALLGHSAGADIVSNVAVNPAYLRRRGQSLRALRCFAPLDTAGFDKPKASPREQVQWRLALSNLAGLHDRDVGDADREARPGIPRRSRSTADAEPAARSRPRSRSGSGRIGVPADPRGRPDLNHAQVNSRIGAPGDTVMTPPLVSFLRVFPRWPAVTHNSL